VGEQEEHVIAIGDVHGCNDELQLLLNKVPLTSDTTIVFLGDYVDRGPDSKGVIDTVLELSKQHKVVTLRGNHEDMMLDFIEDPYSGEAGTFLYNGGAATLGSYRDDKPGEYTIPDEHVQFLKNLDLYYENEGFFFVHAGVPDIPLDTIDPEEHRNYLLWVRKPFLDSRYRWKKKVVHGHTPVPEVERRSNRTNIDTGCVQGNVLTAIDLPSGRLFQVAKQTIEPSTRLSDPETRRRTVRFPGALEVVIHKGGRQINLETLNHNEYGMFCRDVTSAKQELMAGEHVRGVIGPESRSPVEFVAEVLRARDDDDAFYYAMSLSVISGGRSYEP
jgi:serine/threonine protein phosphatase 1